MLELENYLKLICHLFGHNMYFRLFLRMNSPDTILRNHGMFLNLNV